MANKLQVEAIEQGTVIDHIPAGQGVKILKFFQLTNKRDRITVGLNLRSGEHACKDLIKVENTIFTEAEANQLALFAPHATINVIENYEVVKKFKVARPAAVAGVFACPNSNCISHQEPVLTNFYIRERGEQLKLKCHYCEKSFGRDLFIELD